MRLLRKHAAPVRAVHTREAWDATGGVYREDAGEEFTLQAVVLRASRGLALAEGGVLVSPTRGMLVEKGAQIRLYDRVTLPGEGRRLMVTQVREMPRHTRVELGEAP